jgi:L-threonylcarbamoyladenylate synthase
LTNWPIKQAARAVARGGVIAYPTEAVFGLGCDPWNSAAIARIMQLKRRKLSKGLILIAADKAQLEPFIRFPNRAVLERVCSTWPGPVTWVLPACAGIPRGLRGDHQSLAVRVTAHPLARALCTLTGALVSTSANPSGCPPARCVQRVRSYFKNTLDYILPGELGQESSPTEIRDALTGEVLRPSSIPSLCQ